MDIIERKEAKAKFLKTYYTGKECRNGHLTYRYTLSGSCAACVNSDKFGEADPLAPDRRIAKANLLQVRFRLFDVDRESFAVAAWAMAAMRYPMLALGDIDPRVLCTNKAVGTGMYAFNCHSDDVGELGRLAVSMVAGHRVDVAQGRMQAIRAGEAHLPPDTTPPMNFN